MTMMVSGWVAAQRQRIARGHVCGSRCRRRRPGRRKREEEVEGRGLILMATSGWPGGGVRSVCSVYTAGKRRASLVVSESACGSWWDSQPLYSAQISKCLVPLSKRARFTSSYKARVLCLRNYCRQQQHASSYANSVWLYSQTYDQPNRKFICLCTRQGLIPTNIYHITLYSQGDDYHTF